MEGETTLDEERALGDWLRTHEVDDTLKPYQRMFAAFDAGLLLPAGDAEPSSQPLTPRERGEDVSKRRRWVWWRWAAAAVFAGLLALGGIRLAKRPIAPTGQPPVVAKGTPEPAVDTIVENVDMKPIIAESQQEDDKPASPIVSANKKAEEVKPKAAAPSKQDSIEVVRTAGNLELAESEFQAEQQELERQLQELRRQRLTRQSGWHYTTLPCE